MVEGLKLGRVGIEGAQLQLLGGFALIDRGMSVDIPSTGQRVLALLGVMGGSAHRSQLAGTLWPDQTERRAFSNMRAAVWRLPAGVRDVIERHGAIVKLGPQIDVDLVRATQLACDLLDHRGVDDGVRIGLELLCRDVLPGMDEEWLVVPRECHKQRRLHALEALARRDLEDARPLDAVDAALAAVGSEPLRESAQLLVIRAHLAAGNRSAALDQYHHFKRLLATELCVEPSRELTDLVLGIGDRR
jgi:DNA-binding SARP family transcriptional activator